MNTLRERRLTSRDKKRQADRERQNVTVLCTVPSVSKRHFPFSSRLLNTSPHTVWSFLLPLAAEAADAVMKHTLRRMEIDLRFEVDVFTAPRPFPQGGHTKKSICSRLHVLTTTFNFSTIEHQKVSRLYKAY